MLEAFSNEISSLTDAFIFDVKRDPQIQYLTTEQQESKIGMSYTICQNIAEIKNNTVGSFYDRYKDLLAVMKIGQPDFLQELCHLSDLRNALVHFRLCDVPIVEDEGGIIRYSQEPPEVFAHLKSHHIEKGWPVVATDTESNSVEWTLRVSTNAMAIWSLTLTLDAIMYVLNSLPGEERYTDFIRIRYRARDESFKNIFTKGKCDVQEWKTQLFESIKSNGRQS